MELILHHQNFNFFKKIFDSSFNREETMEMIVPDSLPDVLNIVDSDGTVILRSKEADSAKVSLSGFVRSHIIYQPDGDGSPRCLSLQLPFSVSLDNNDFSPDSKVVASAQLSAIDARLINSRKIIVRADILFHLSVFENSSFSISTDADAPDIEVLKASCSLSPIVDISEKSFSFSDELPFPSSKPPIASILKSNLRLIPEESKAVGSKLILKGIALINLIYSPSSGGSLESADFSLPFSQIVELAQDFDDPSFDVSFLPTGLFIQESGDEMSANQSISIEIAALAQVSACSKIDLLFLSDIYSTSFPTICHPDDLSLNCLVAEHSLRDTFRDTINTPEPPRSIIATSILPGKIRRDDEGFLIPISASVLFSSDNSPILRSSARFDFHFPFDFHSSDSDFSPLLSFSEVFASPVASGIELRIPFELSLREFKNSSFSPLSHVSLDLDSSFNSADLPSVVICRVAPDDSLWSLAKRFNSTRDLIRSANNLNDSDSISENQLLLISKKR